MLKRVIHGSGVMGVLTAGYLLGSVSLGGAFAQTAPATTTPAPLETSPATEEHGGTGQAEANDQTESAALASQAKITAAQPNATALGQFAGGTVNKTELDSENGTLMLDGTRTSRGPGLSEVHSHDKSESVSALRTVAPAPQAKPAWGQLALGGLGGLLLGSLFGGGRGGFGGFGDNDDFGAVTSAAAGAAADTWRPPAGFDPPVD